MVVAGHLRLFRGVHVVVHVATDEHVRYLKDPCEFGAEQRVVLLDAYKLFLDGDDVALDKLPVAVDVFTLDS